MAHKDSPEYQALAPHLQSFVDEMVAAMQARVNEPPAIGVDLVFPEGRAKLRLPRPLASFCVRLWARVSGLVSAARERFSARPDRAQPEGTGPAKGDE